jgi:hypothetical protein
VTILFGDPIRWHPRVEAPAREQQQEVANQIFAEIRSLYGQLEAEGRKGVLKRVRALRREARKHPATA